MAFDLGNYLIIGGNRSGNFFVHERENKDGKPGKIITMVDGKGDVNEVAKEYIQKGFDPSKVIINGQPACDLFEKSDSDNPNTKKSDVNKNLKQFATAAFLMNNPGLAMLLMPEQTKAMLNRENPIGLNKNN